MAVVRVITGALAAGASGMWVACAFALLLAAQLASAQELAAPVPGYVHRVWTTRQGLPQNIVRALVQTRDGYLWIGTGSGLVRFDGVTFTLFEITKTPELGANYIRSLFEDRAGTLWIGTVAGVTRYRAGVFTREPVDARAQERDVFAIQEDRRGQLWAASAFALLRRDGSRWTSIPFPTRVVPLVDRHDRIWIGTTSGDLIQWRDGETRRAITPRDGLPRAAIQALVEDREGRIWVGTARGLARVDPETGRVTREPAPLAEAPIHSLVEDRAGRLWIGSVNTLFLRTREGRIAAYPIADTSDAARILSPIETRDGQLWFGVEGGRGGLHALTPQRVAMVGRDEGLPCTNVTFLAERGDGDVWAGLLCPQGVDNLVTIRNGRVQQTIATAADGSASFTGMSALALLPDGGALIGTFGGALLHVKDGRATRYRAPEAQVYQINALHRDAQGVVWLGTIRGLVRHADGRWTTLQTRDGLVSNDVRTIVDDDRNGGLWIGTAGGLSHYKDGRFTSYTVSDGVPPGPVRAIHADSDGTLWIGTYGGGLARFKDGRWTRFGLQDGLLEGAVHRILEDDRGNFWLSGDRGIRRVKRRELNEIADGKPTRLSVVLIDENDGMTNAECNGMGQPAGWKMRDGTLWFPTQDGIARVDPATIGRRAAAPMPVIEAVKVDGVDLARASRVTVPPGAQDLQIAYSAPTLVRAAQVQFQYRLTGHDPAWIDAGTSRVVTYANLAPGEYRFELRARSITGVWSDRAASLALALQPFFYQRPSFRLFGGLIVALAVAGGVRYRVVRLQDRAGELAARVAERTAELDVEREGLRVVNAQLSTANAQLSAAKADLESSHTNLLSVLEQLRIGIVITDARQHVLFVSKALRPLIGMTGEEAVGQALARVLPVTEQQLAQLQPLLSATATGPRMTVELRPRNGPRYWAEVDVRPDPRDAQNRIVCLYDVTETYDLKRAIEAEPGGAVAGLIGESPGIRLVHRQIRTLAAVDAPVLIEGETGTGKELVARAIHAASRRHERPFIAINCAGLTESLLASQLFGHRRGAFTGAVSDHVGFFEAAQGGTILLDEIGDMPVSVQTHLLRVLQEREILRVGDSRPRPINVRVLAATHRNLDHEVTANRFREDLLYRIRVARVTLPPLRMRVGDVPHLAAAFLQQAATAHGKPVPSIGAEAMEHLMRYPWPGNVRELKSACEWVFIHQRGPLIALRDLPPEILAPPGVPPPPQPLLTNERRLVIETLRRTGGNRSVAARLLGVSRATLYRRLAALEADEPVPPPADPDSDREPHPSDGE